MLTGSILLPRDPAFAVNGRPAPKAGATPPAAPSAPAPATALPDIGAAFGRLRRYAPLAALLLFVLGLLVYKTQGDYVDYDVAERTLRKGQQIDAEWSVEVLRLVAGLQASHDKVAAPLAELAANVADVERLVASVSRARPGSAALPALAAAYRDAVARKTDIVQRIQSQHAILMNSTRFLPSAESDLQRALDESALPGTQRTLLGQDSRQLVSGALRYLTAPDPLVADALRIATKRLAEGSQALDPAVRERLETLTAHVRIVLDQRALGGQLMAAFSAVSVSAAIDALADGLQADRRTAQREQQRYQVALAAYGVVLLVVVVALAAGGYRLARRYLQLSASHDTLKGANRESQMLLIQSAKMSAIGRMVAGVAHEINTPLAYVKATFEVLREQLLQARDEAEDDAHFGRLLASDGGRELLNDISSLLDDGMHGIQQITHLVLTLKNFSRTDKVRSGDFCVQQGLEAALEIAHHLLKNVVEVKREYRAVPRIHCSPSQINQVFLNLITNAVQAMPKDRPEPGVITVRTQLHDAQTVRIDVADNGMGIPADLQQKIFEPFFTTKPVGEGTGTGLAICYRIIEDHGGRIIVDSEVGAGTTFSVLLPIAESSAPAAAAPPAADAGLTSRA